MEKAYFIIYFIIVLLDCIIIGIPKFPKKASNIRTVQIAKLVLGVVDLYLHIAAIFLGIMLNYPLVTIIAGTILFTGFVINGSYKLGKYDQKFILPMFSLKITMEPADDDTADDTDDSQMNDNQ